MSDVLDIPEGQVIPVVEHKIPEHLFKFVCVGHKAYPTSILKDGAYIHVFLYEYLFTPVAGVSEEDAAFYADTPSGILRIAGYQAKNFEVGKSYYLDMWGS